MNEQQLPARPVTVVVNTVVLTAIIACTFGFGRYLFRVLLPDIRADIGFNYATAGLLTAAISVGYLVFTFLIPPVTGRLGAGRIVLAANLVCTAGLLVLSQLTTTWTVGLILFVFGAASSGSWVPIVDVVSRYAPPQHQVKVLGLITSGVNYGIFISGLLTPIILVRVGWRPLWIVVGGLALLITLLAAWVMGRGGLLHGDVTPAGDDSRHAVSAVSLWQRLRSIKRPFVLLILMHGMGGIHGPTYGTYLSAYIRDELGLSLLLTGQVWAIIGVGGMASGLVMGWLGDRFGIRRTIQLVYLCALASALLVMHHQYPFELLLAGAFNAFGFIPMYGQVAGYVAKAAPPRERTFLFGMVNLLHGLLSMIATYLGGLLQTWTGTFFWVYLMIGTAALLSLLVSLLMPKAGEVPPQTAVSPS